MPALFVLCFCLCYIQCRLFSKIIPSLWIWWGRLALWFYLFYLLLEFNIYIPLNYLRGYFFYCKNSTFWLRLYVYFYFFSINFLWFECFFLLPISDLNDIYYKLYIGKVFMHFNMKFLLVNCSLKTNYSL